MIVPAVTKFLSDYPDCRADLRFNDRIVDILAGEIDVAIRVGWLTDSSLRARRLGGFRQLLVASRQFAGALEGMKSLKTCSASVVEYGVARTQNVDLHQRCRYSNGIQQDGDARRRQHRRSRCGTSGRCWICDPAGLHGQTGSRRPGV